MNKPPISSVPLAEPSPPLARYLTAPQVRTRYGDVTEMCLWRWRNDPKVGFPPPDLCVNNRLYWLETTLITWERRGRSGGEAA
jgi:hypothetical protein